jgi:prolyl oligopeptidase
MTTLKRMAVLGLILGFLAGCQTNTTAVRSQETSITYPQARKGDVVDDYHGVKVADPYRWMENVDSPETTAWIEAENKITFNFLEDIPARDKIRDRITKLYDYEKYGMPFREGGRYFFSKNDGLQPQSVIFWMESLGDEPRVLIDPNTFSEDGTVALSGLSVSDDGKLVAYATSDGGSDWQEYKVREVDTGRDLDDHVQWVKFSGASWTMDNKGFFYSRYAKPDEETKLQDTNYNQKLYYHTLRTPQSQDQLVYERPDHKDWMINGGVTDDGRYLILYISKGDDDNNLIYYKELGHEGSPIIELISDWEARYGFIDNDGPVFWFTTNYEAPKNRIIAIDTRKPDKADWTEIIPEVDETLRGANVVNNMFVTNYMKDAHTQVRMYDLSGKFVRDVDFPGLCTAGGFGGKRNYTETFYAYTSFTDPGSIYRYDMVTGKSTLFKRPKVDFDSDDYVARQVFYTSKDGTRVPMFIVHKKGLRLDGKNPTYLYAYGGFNISLTPFFSVTNAVWLQMGGVYALANIRGGGEYGKEWHEAAIKLHRQKAFDDFIAAAEYLIDNNYTCRKKLAIGGGSNGGLLVGAVMTQRPDLFAAAMPQVGVFDMLRYNKYTIGWAWASDFGTPDNPEEFQALYAYSPYHNVKPGTKYPATLMTTADHDDRVFPAHSFKFAAALQADQAGNAPILIRIETRAGHGAGKPTQKRIEEAADRWAFLVRELGMHPKL